MQINTNTGRLTLTKTERGYLQKATKVLLGIAKHGDGELANRSEGAADTVGEVLQQLAEEPAAA